MMTYVILAPGLARYGDKSEHVVAVLRASFNVLAYNTAYHFTRQYSTFMTKVSVPLTLVFGPDISHFEMRSSLQIYQHVRYRKRKSTLVAAVDDDATTKI